MKRPIVWFVVLWVAGYALANQLQFSWLTLTVSIALGGAAAAVWVLRIRGRLLICAVLLVGVSMGYYQWNDQRNTTALPPLPPEAELSGRDAVLRGRLAGPVAIDGDKAGFTLEAEMLRFQDGTAFPLGGERVQVSLRLLRPEEQAQAAGWQRGDALTLQGLLRSPSPARNFGGFDYRRYLRLHRTHWLFTAKGTDQAQHEPAPLRANVVQLLRWNDGLRAALAGRMDRIFPQRHAGFMKAMLIGQQDDLDPERFQQFSELGLTHILAISGLNVAVFLGVCIWIMRKLRLTKETYLLVCICLLPAYILITGASPSIVRAGLMAMIALFAVRQGILKDALHLTAIVAWLMLMWNPYYLLDVGFQLSFLVTIGLIIGVRKVTSLLPFRSSVISNTLSITIVSQLISFPISIYYFNQFSLLSWVANAILVPVISMVVFPIGLISLAAGLIHLPLGQWLGWLLALLNDIIFRTTDMLQLFRMFRMVWPTPGSIWIAAYYLLVIILYLVLEQRKQILDLINKMRNSEGSPDLGVESNLEANSRTALQPAVRIQFPVMLGKPARYWGLSPELFLSRRRSLLRLSLILTISACTLLLYMGYSPERFNRSGLVHFIDVGQGDSILIRTPEGRHLLIDGGGTLSFRKPGEEWKERKDPYEVGRKLLVPLLKKRGVHELDIVILTHEDADHIGGLQAVAEQIPIKQLLFNGTFKRSPGVGKLFETLLDRQVPLIAIEQGEPMVLEPGTSLEFLYPFPDGSDRVKLQDKQNNESLVFMMRMEGTTWLFTGDMEKEAENEMLDWLKGRPRISSQIDVMKVAHHGSKTSTTQAWLEYWKPQYAVISVGATNSYGHPSKEVVQRMEQSNIRIFRTDQMGEVQFQAKGGRLYTRTKLMESHQKN